VKSLVLSESVATLFCEKISKSINSQDLLLKQIRKQITQGSSINDIIATVLNVRYDAAHRRVSGKSKFSY
jgi:hypothetical protein